MLEILEVVRKSIPRGLGAERPNLSVTKDQDKEPGSDEAHRPNIAHQRPACRQAALQEDENPCDYNKGSNQTMIELTFLFIRQMLGRLRGVFACCRRVHIHSRHIAHVVFLRPRQSREQKQGDCEQAHRCPGI